MEQEAAAMFLKSLRRDVFEKGNRDLIDKYFTEDLIGHYGDITFNREHAKERIDYVNKRYVYRAEHILDLVVVPETNMIIYRLKQNGYDAYFERLYTLELVIIYRMIGNRIAEVWLMSDSPIDYFARSDDSYQMPKEKLSAEEVEKRDFILLLKDMHKHDRKVYVELTCREQECLFYFFKGFTTKEIAKKLDISHRTVEDYLASVRRKYGCSNKFELRKKVLLV